MVLLVEDSQPDIDLTLHGISAFNVITGVAKTPKEALRELQSRRYDVALVDLRLEEGSGLDVLRLAQNTNIDTIFIVLTGVEEDSPTIKEALDSGAKFIVQKPLTKEHLNLIFGTL